MEGSEEAMPALPGLPAAVASVGSDPIDAVALAGGGFDVETVHHILKGVRHCGKLDVLSTARWQVASKCNGSFAAYNLVPRLDTAAVLWRLIVTLGA